MKTERFEQVDRIFQAAIEREPAERQAYIDEACGGDAELRSRVEALLSADERAGNFIETPAYEVAGQRIEERLGTMAGKQLGPYRVASPLGAGGMGEVYLAEDLRLGRKVALKLLASHSTGDSQLRGRFLREARLASTLDHPNICTIFEVGEDSGHSYIAMQYVEGKTLKELVDRQPLGLKSLLSISLQVANALEAAHGLGIIHRDIKPSNIMVTARGQAKVLDFGLAKLMDEREVTAISEEYRELTRTGAVMGTPAFMSPEQARGERADHRSDIFSFGVVMYVMATGRVPFRGKSQAETMNAVINDGHTPVTELNKEAPSGLSAVIDRALAKEPGDRYQSMTAMIAELRQVAQEAQVITSSEPDDMIIPYVPVRERAQSGRLRQLMKSPALGVSLLLLLVLAAALMWWQPWKRPPSQTQQHLISAFPGHHRAASFSPDGSMIAFISDAGGVPQVWVKNLAQGDPLQITFGEIPAHRPRWSPNNDQIVFGRGTSTSSQDIWSLPPLGGTPRKLIEGGRNPNWSWDGGRLVYEKGDDVWTARADGSEQRRLEGIPSIEFHLGDRMPAYSRDGSLIAFFHNSAGPLGDIWVIPSAGGQPRQLTSDITISSTPVWLAADRYIVYSSQRGGSTTLWKVPTAGGKPEPVLISPGEDSDPEVSRDGTKLIYTNTRNSYVITQMNPATKQTRELREARNMHCDPRSPQRGTRSPSSRCRMTDRTSSPWPWTAAISRKSPGRREGRIHFPAGPQMACFCISASIVRFLPCKKSPSRAGQALKLRQAGHGTSATGASRSNRQVARLLENGEWRDSGNHHSGD